MTPYRTAPVTLAPPPREAPGDDQQILWIALLVGLLGVVPHLGSMQAWGGQEPLPLLLVAGSGAALARHGVRGAWRRLRAARAARRPAP